MGGREEAPPENQEEDEEGEGPLINMNRKEQRAADKKAEKEERKAARAQAIEENQKRMSDKYEKRWERERAMEEKFEKEEEEARKLAEEKAKAEEEEFMKWKDLITVEDEGEERSVLEGEGSLEKFLQYIKMRKVVELEALGSEFQLDAKTIIDRIQDLLKQKTLTGIIDERGKFIYITEEEMNAVKKFIERKGRVSRLDLARESNRLIRLNPTAEDKAKIEAEEKALVSNLEFEENKTES